MSDFLQDECIDHRIMYICLEATIGRQKKTTVVKHHFDRIIIIIIISDTPKRTQSLILTNPVYYQ